MSKKQIRETNQKNAIVYDIAVRYLYPIIGLRINEYRGRAVSRLQLNPGDYVVDLAVGPAYVSSCG